MIDNTTQSLVERCADLRAECEQFTGSATMHCVSRSGLPFYITDGVKYVMEKAECRWLLNSIFKFGGEVCQSAGDQPFLVFKFAVKPDNTGILTIEDGNHNVLTTQPTEETDLLLGRDEPFSFWLVKNEHGGRTLMLPSEY